MVALRNLIRISTYFEFFAVIPLFAESPKLSVNDCETGLAEATSELSRHATWYGVDIKEVRQWLFRIHQFSHFTRIM